MAKSSWAQHLIRPRIHFLFHSKGLSSTAAIKQTMKELNNGILTGKRGDQKKGAERDPPGFAVDVRRAVVSVGVKTEEIDLLIASIASATDAQIPALIKKHLRHRVLSAAENRRLLAAIKRYRREVNRF